jgi:HEAT repeat protein
MIVVNGDYHSCAQTPHANQVDALAEGLSDPSALFRHEIAYVLGQIGDPCVVDTLKKVHINAPLKF